MAVPSPSESLGSPEIHEIHTASLQNLLLERAKARSPRFLIFYPQGNISTTPLQVSYQELYQRARQNSTLVRSLPQFKVNSPILLHLSDHYDSILWFWTVLLAKGLPVMSSTFSSVEEHRTNQINNLSTILESPICITRTKDLHFFGEDPAMHIYTIELLCQGRQQSPDLNCTAQPMNNGHHITQKDEVPNVYEGGDSLAMLMLTSGSTGNARAVRLTHKQVFASIMAKSATRILPAGHPFLNWIGFDHVASVVEIHIPALHFDVDQVHVHASDIVSSPRTFLDLLSQHRVCRTFAPNFMLARLATVEFDPKWDLTALTFLASGGEANDVSTCVAVSALFEKCGAAKNVIVPGFGMTETCAGSIYNLDCPNADLHRDYTVASVGKCINGIEFRLTVNSESETIELAAPDEIGSLEVRGQIVFQGYYRQPEADRKFFTSDGWFRTGDQGVVDGAGNLRLMGRTKDVFNINGIKMACSDVQNYVEGAIRSVVARTICFPSKEGHTERITVAYIPLEWPMKDDAILQIEDLIVQACFACSGSSPMVFAIGKDSASLLPTTALGKISRLRMSTIFAAGHFTKDMNQHRLEVRRIRQKQHAHLRENFDKSATEYEERLVREIAEAIGIPSSKIDVDTNIFELGITSLDLVRLKHRLEGRLNIELPTATLIRNASARALATALYSEDRAQPPYDPVVALNSKGIKTPLWLVHPGVGEVLVFVGLAQHLGDDDRPIYALRARGFEGQEPFNSIEEAVDIYVDAIRSRQPYGPYALAGYSYGTMLAFEISKKLEASGGPVGFLGSFNLPPHIKLRMRQLNWNICLLHLSYFTGLTSEAFANELEERGEFRALSRSDAVKRVLEASNTSRLEELGLSEEDLMQWTRVSYSLQKLAVDYDPEGTVRVMDVFHAVPLKMAARSREEWVSEHLSKWQDFCETQPSFHEVGGAHYTMLGMDHVDAFAATLKAALMKRGL
ncbi:putative AMP-binding & Acyl-protein [Rosellinia necatrix]|uniref:Putative AMP-binding & Acyl-protein n=1 Tax=Rosellinia necatrix TaxID=77044 RepID=A0A1W2TAV1_ROSNE|nr:putative AMP-binding & Acyl-protein [Rosellinia necatrix]